MAPNVLMSPRKLSYSHQAETVPKPKPKPNGLKHFVLVRTCPSVWRYDELISKKNVRVVDVDVDVVVPGKWPLPYR